MKGFVPTPRETVDLMVDLLFRGGPPAPQHAVLDPGCGTGAFIDGVIRWCRLRGTALPRITGVESDPRHIPILRAKYKRLAAVRIEHADFLNGGEQRYEYIVGNPPYVPITGLSESERVRYRARYATARGRFDLYLLFFEEALRRLSAAGRLVFITPEKYLYVASAGSLRELLGRRQVEEIRLLREDTFGKLVTYPTITVVNHSIPAETHLVRRDGSVATVKLPYARDSWWPVLEGDSAQRESVTLADLCLRVSCGVATGADGVYVRRAAELDPSLRPYARPTIAGRELKPSALAIEPRFVMLVPYDTAGRLIPLGQLGGLGRYLARTDVRRRLLARTCTRRKPWYAFHETPALAEILRPKILCKDIAKHPHFWADRSGEIVPRHSVYYLVPREAAALEVILDYLRSRAAHTWLRRNCQRASSGFLRIQSRVLQRLPVPDDVARAALNGRPVVRTRENRQGQLSFA